MKISARNVITCTIKKINVGAVNTEILLSLPDGQELVSVITNDSVKTLGLENGKVVKAIVKASNVMIGIDD